MRLSAFMCRVRAVMLFFFISTFLIAVCRLFRFRKTLLSSLVFALYAMVFHIMIKTKRRWKKAIARLWCFPWSATRASILRRFSSFTRIHFRDSNLFFPATWRMSKIERIPCARRINEITVYFPVKGSTNCIYAAHTYRGALQNVWNSFVIGRDLKPKNWASMYR